METGVKDKKKKQKSQEEMVQQPVKRKFCNVEYSITYKQTLHLLTKFRLRRPDHHRMMVHSITNEIFVKHKQVDLSPP